jgi:esterase/lipase superfamily enzyme
MGLPKGQRPNVVEMGRATCRLVGIHVKAQARTPAWIGCAAMAVLMLIVQGCASRPDPQVLASVATAASDGVQMVRVYAATTRARQTPGTNRFSDELSTTTNHGVFDISLPPSHRSGEIEWPKGKPDPRASFAVRDQKVLDRETFLRSVVSEPAKGDTGVFIHGYNTSFEEAVFRVAQMAVDADLGGVPILFAWPSQASVMGYLTDREAVTASRDNLAALLVELAERRGAKEATVFAHSMGAWLLMESLRQLKLQGRDDVLSRLHVFLAAPDIDEGVFQAQLAVIGKMRTPITIFVSRDDVALRLSGFLAGNRRRIGSLDISNPAVVDASRKNGVRIVDISKLDAQDRLKHDRYAALAGIQRQAGIARTNYSLLHGTGAFVFDITGARPSYPFAASDQTPAP